MADLSKTVIAKSDQMNAVDIVGSQTIKITKVDVKSGDQPVSIFYEGEPKKPWKPCLNMRRAIIEAWGSEGDNYVGKSITLFNDKTVVWAGVESGGIRISHMSDIDRNIKLMLSFKRGKKTPYLIKKIETDAPVGNPIKEDELEDWKLKFSICETKEDIEKLTKALKEKDYNKDSKAKIMKFFSDAMTKIGKEKK